MPTTTVLYSMCKNMLDVKSKKRQHPVAKILFACLGAYIVCVAPCHAQVVNFESYGIQDGLSHPTIWTIFEDSKGFIWFGTENGLNKFDGYGFEVFKNDRFDSLSIGSNTIKDIAEDSNGNLWIATPGSGINKYDPVSSTFTRYAHESTDTNSILTNRARTLCLGNNNTLWIGTTISGLISLDIKTGKFDNHTYANNKLNLNIESLYYSKTGLLWVGTWGGGLFSINGDGEVKNYLNPDNLPDQSSVHAGIDVIFQIHEDQDGYLWLATWGSGLLKFDTKDGSYLQYNNQSAGESALSDNIITDLTYSNGFVWATTFNGLNRLNVKTGVNKIFYHDKFDPGTISENGNWSVMANTRGIVWTGPWDRELANTTLTKINSPTPLQYSKI
ncbi:MAG: hypothetical protein HC896_03355 [Bacteroidales bacterium]|nr:hypothetical protein [Bacteroidales bacterium]